MEEVKLLTMIAEQGGTLGLVLAALVTATGIYVRGQLGAKTGTEPTRGDTERLKTVVANVSDIDRRLARVESEFIHLPTKDELHSLDKDLAALQAQVEGVEKTTQRTGYSVERIENYLLQIAESKP